MYSCLHVSCRRPRPPTYTHRQIHRPYAKPLIIFSPKFLLHHKRCTSRMSDLEIGTFFHRCIFERGLGDNMIDRNRLLLFPADQITRVVLCTGKIFYNLFHLREAEKLKHVTIVRIEQLAPFPHDLIGPALHLYKNAVIVWVQEVCSYRS